MAIAPGAQAKHDTAYMRSSCRELGHDHLWRYVQHTLTYMQAILTHYQCMVLHNEQLTEQSGGPTVVHTCPHPLKQHFPSPQSSSLLHNSAHIPG